MAKKRKRSEVPMILRRLFQKRVRTLADGIIALIPSPPPPSPAECHCKGRRCLGCCRGDEAISFLLRPTDPPEYRKLLTESFLVVAENAPPFSSRDHCSRSSQLGIVRMTIEIVISKQLASTNVLCHGYDENKRSSAVLDLLTSSAWKLLSRRVGDVLMFYLLRYTSMFLPHSRKEHHQVTGYPVSGMCKLSKRVRDTTNQNDSKCHLGFGKKRKRGYEVDLFSVKQQPFSSLESGLSSSNTCAGCNCLTYLTQSNGHQRNTSSQAHSEKPTIASGTKCANKETCALENRQDSSNQTGTLPKKRVENWKSRRQRKRRHLNPQGSFSLIPCTDGIGFPSEFNPNSNCHEKTMSWCACCLVFQSLPKVMEKASINRRIMFYKLEDCSSLFPRNRANALFKDIFGYPESNITGQSLPCFHSINCCRVKSICRYHSLIKLLKKLIRNAGRCQPLRFLDKHCAIPFLEQKADGGSASKFEGDYCQGTLLTKEYDGVQLGKKLQNEEVHGFNVKRIPETQDCQFEPSKSFSSQKQVIEFIWDVCRSIVPPDLLGTPSNWRILRENISRFVRLRRFENFSLKQCMHKLKMSKFPFVSNKHSFCYLGNYVSEVSERCRVNMCNLVQLDATEIVKDRILGCWIYWLFSCLVVPLVQANFYVTESEHGKQEVFYYRKAVWEKLTANAVTCLKSQNYRQLSDVFFRKIVENRSFGFSKVRLCPKNNGVRVLANLKLSSRIPEKYSSLTIRSNRMKRLFRRPTNVKYHSFRSVNSVLRNAHVILKSIQMKEPEKLGSSVFDYNDVYRKLVPFILLLKTERTTMPDLFITVSDVSKAFDSVNQDKLLSVIDNVLLASEYTQKKSLKVACTKKSLWVHQHLSPADQDGIPNSRRGTFVDSIHSLHAILVKQGHIKIEKKEISNDLFEHIKRNVLRLDNRFYLQSVGIPQGGILSSLLCSFYYGHLDNNVIYPYLEKACEAATIVGEISAEGNLVFCKPKYLLLRLIDDYLFISTSKVQASKFFSRIQRGFREYNCHMNEGKFGVNFDTNHTSESRLNRVSVGEDGISFLKWSGFLINCCTLEIQADYSRYHGSHLSSTLTVNWRVTTKRILREKVHSYLRPKCHPIFYDSNINSPGVVRLNIYQSFLLCAMKFHCYVALLSTFSKINPKSFIYILEPSLRYMHKLIKKRMQTIHLDSDIRPLLQVESWETEWLGLVAYIRVLKRKPARYRKLLSSLRYKLRNHPKAENISDALKYAVDDSHSSIFWKIKY